MNPHPDPNRPTSSAFVHPPCSMHIPPQVTISNPTAMLWYDVTMVNSVAYTDWGFVMGTGDFEKTHVPTEDGEVEICVTAWTAGTMEFGLRVDIEGKAAESTLPRLPASAIKLYPIVKSVLAGKYWEAQVRCPGGAREGGGYGREFGGEGGGAPRATVGAGRGREAGGRAAKMVKRPPQQPPQPPIRQLLGNANAQTAHPAATSTAPAHQLLGSANAEMTPARAPAAAADRTQRRRNMRKGERVTVQGPVKKQQPDGMSHGGGEEAGAAALLLPTHPGASMAAGTGLKNEELWWCV